MHDVAFLDNIVLALEAQPAGIPCTGLTAEFRVIVVGNRFGTNKAFLKIRVNFASCLRCPGPNLRRPGPYLFFARREKRLQPKQVVRMANNTIETRLLGTKVL